MLLATVVVATANPIVAPLNAPPSREPNANQMKNQTIIYNIICGGFNTSPIVTLRDCRLEVISGRDLGESANINTDYGNVQLNSPLNVHDDATIQNNQFATIHNFQQYGIKDSPRAMNGTIEVQDNKKKN